MRRLMKSFHQQVLLLVWLELKVWYLSYKFGKFSQSLKIVCMSYIDPKDVWSEAAKQHQIFELKDNKHNTF